jgi:hypothetical protein
LERFVGVNKMTRTFRHSLRAATKSPVLAESSALKFAENHARMRLKMRKSVFLP